MSPFSLKLKTPFLHRLCGLWMAWVLMSIGLVSRGETPVNEYKVKAGYIYNFAKFMTWPAPYSVDQRGAFVIGVFDSGEAFSVIESVLKGKKIGEFPVLVKRIQDRNLHADLHVLFITRSINSLPNDYLDAVRSHGTLLVGESEDFATTGGIVEFMNENDRILLKINSELANRSGLKVSSNLLQIAKIVKNP